MVLAPTTTLLAQYFDKRRGLANCLAQAGASGGSLVFPILLRTLLNNYSLFGTLLFVGAMNLHLAVAGSLLRPTYSYLKSRGRDKPTASESNHDSVDSSGHVQISASPKILNDNRDTLTHLGEKNGMSVKTVLNHNQDVVIKYGKDRVNLVNQLDSEEHHNQSSKDFKQENNDYTTNCLANGDTCRNQLALNVPSSDSKHNTVTDVQEPLLYYSPNVAQAILGRRARERHNSDISNTSKRGPLYAGVSSSSIGRYASTELSVSSVLDLRRRDTASVRISVGDSVNESKMSKLCCFKKKQSTGALDCRVLRRLPLWFFQPSACLLCSSCSMVLVFLPPLARDKGLTDSEITVFMSAIGGIDIIALLIWGIIADCGCLKRYQLVIIAALIFGVAVNLCPFYVNFSSFMAISVVCGLMGRVYFSLYPVLLVDFLGLDYLRSALGVSVTTQTIFNAFMLPLIGKVKPFEPGAQYFL